MKNDEIRLANRKALPKFIFAMAIMSAIGGVTGYFCAKYGSDNFTEGMKKAGKFFGTDVAPWLMPALAVAIPIACTPICLSAKKLIDTWDGENDNISDTIDRKLSSQTESQALL